MTTTRICLHGPESTGKSTLGTRLAAHLGCEVVPEYGRAYCEAHGTDIGMAELVHIAQQQDVMNRAAAARAAELDIGQVLFDTDPLITAVWAEMMFGQRDPWFDSFSSYADLYLVLDIDLPFVDDGLRVYASPEQRRRFFDLCKTELDRRGVPYALIRGAGDARFDAALRAIEISAFGDNP
ncbi:AAA family ATPase [Sphingorhabdus contaminans]|uniref:AAA family ATPase n=1 Tax=Sphingorhabdus contaminans TaxID=1343899 RepID=UPI003D29DE6A